MVFRYRSLCCFTRIGQNEEQYKLFAFSTSFDLSFRFFVSFRWLFSSILAMALSFQYDLRLYPFSAADTLDSFCGWVNKFTLWRCDLPLISILRRTYGTIEVFFANGWTNKGIRWIKIGDGYGWMSCVVLFTVSWAFLQRYLKGCLFWVALTSYSWIVKRKCDIFYSYPNYSFYAWMWV